MLKHSLISYSKDRPNGKTKQSQELSGEGR